MPRTWDLVVVGAGPAGSAAALGALRTRPGASVLLLDRADFPRDKACGDGIAAHALDELVALGVADPVHGYPPLRRLEIRGPAGGIVRGEMARAVRVVPRGSSTPGWWRPPRPPAPRCASHACGG